MRTPFASLAATAEERRAVVAGDGLVPDPDVVMDRGFVLPAPPEQVWPWLVQLGKHRAGWYLPRTVERLVPRRRRALRDLDPRWQALAVGDVISDYGGRDATFEVVVVEPPRRLVFWSRRGRLEVSWALVLAPVVPAGERSTSTRVHLRLRLGRLRHRRLARTAGGAVDLLTIAGLAAGLAERLRQGPS